MENFETSAQMALFVSFMLASLTRFAADCEYCERSNIERLLWRPAIYSGGTGLLLSLVWIAADKQVDVFWLWSASAAIGIFRLDVKRVIKIWIASRKTPEELLGEALEDVAPHNEEDVSDSSRDPHFSTYGWL